MLEKTLDRGEEILLDIRDSARRRVVCGLRWDPLTGGSHTVHDLDLLCLVFDKQGRLMEGVTGEEGHRTGDSGNIYHTGDVVDGEDSLDDEQISLELFNISRKVHQIFFIAEVQSAHTFGETVNPEIRIANAIDDRNFAHSYLGQNVGADENAFIFGSIYRHPQGWMFKYVGDYFDGAHIADWTETLKEYIEVEELPEGGAAGSITPAKGETLPLHYTKEARHRIVCGLNWDPLESDVGRIEKLKNLGQNIESFDLDLACVMYDADKEVVDGVSAKPDETVDESGKVYHSGDDTSGEGDGVDDEAISVELKELPDYIHHIVFLAEIQSLHSFDDIINPSMRIADGKTDDEQLTSSLATPEGAGKNAYVFARISREGGDWKLTCIEEFFDGHDIEDWIEHLKRYLA